MIKTRNVLQKKQRPSYPVPEPNRISLPVANFLSGLTPTEVTVQKRPGQIRFVLVEGPWPPPPAPIPKSAREVSEAFLSVQNPQDAADFLARYGPLGSLKYQDFHRPPGSRSTVTWREFCKVQRVIRAAWELPPAEWDGVPDMALGFHINLLDQRQPYLFLATETVVQALVADLVLAALSGLKSGFCARRDCGRLFQKTTRHEKIYCSPECAHVESVRKHRAAKKAR